eukprot:COSAG05_NODE_8581_length_691_cov_0.907095_1_plen_113_part_00
MDGRAPVDAGPDPDLEVVPMLAREYQQNIVMPSHRPRGESDDSSDDEQAAKSDSDSDSSSEEETDPIGDFLSEPVDDGTVLAKVKYGLWSVWDGAPRSFAPVIALAPPSPRP